MAPTIIVDSPMGITKKYSEYGNTQPTIIKSPKPPENPKPTIMRMYPIKEKDSGFESKTLALLQFRR